MTARAGHVEISHAMDTSFFLNAFLCFAVAKETFLIYIQTMAAMWSGPSASSLRVFRHSTQTLYIFNLYDVM